MVPVVSMVPIVSMVPMVLLVVVHMWFVVYVTPHHGLVCRPDHDNLVGGHGGGRTLGPALKQRDELTRQFVQ